MGLSVRKSPWYVAGLAFECVGCGRCCAGPQEGYVWITDEEIAAVAEFLHLSEEQMRRRYVRKVGRRQSLVEQAGTNDCIFLTPAADGSRSCRIYPVRPMQCRTWPFWPSNLRDPESWAEAGVRCPGINRGPLHDAAAIEAKSRATRE
jgi:hypothetical protein